MLFQNEAKVTLQKNFSIILLYEGNGHRYNAGRIYARVAGWEEFERVKTTASNFFNIANDFSMSSDRLSWLTSFYLSAFKLA